MQKCVVKNKKHRICESIRESLEEVKLYKEGKIQLDTWEQFLEELRRENCIFLSKKGIYKKE